MDRNKQRNRESDRKYIKFKMQKIKKAKEKGNHAAAGPCFSFRYLTFIKVNCFLTASQKYFVVCLVFSKQIKQIFIPTVNVFPIE